MDYIFFIKPMQFSESTKNQMTQNLKKKVLLLGLCSVLGVHSFAQFSGNINVGTGQTYTSLTNANGLFNAINNGTVTGDITVKITSNLTAETGTVALNKWIETGTGNYKMNIVPDGTTERIITSRSLNLITINGAANVSINGNPANDGNKYLRFRNDSTSTTGVFSTINFLNDAKQDTVQNCFVEGAGVSATSAVIVLGGSTGTSGNDSIAILNNTIRDTVGTTTSAKAPYSLILNNNAGATKNDYLVIAGNQLLNWGNAAIYFTNAGNKAQILNNALYTITGSRSATAYGIFIGTTGGNGHLISGNSIGGSTSTRSGAPLTSTSIFYIIYQAATTAGDTTVISNNTIGNIYGTSVFGIYNTGGVTTNITNNIIGGGATSYSDTLYCSSGNAYGIYSEGAGIISNNQIRRLKAPVGSTTAGYASGIYVLNMPNLIIDHNTIDSVIGNKPFNLGLPTFYCPSGIQINGTIAGTKHVVSNNTISNVLNTNTITTSFSGSAGIQLSGANAALTVYNNKIAAIYGSNTYDNGASIAGIYSNSTTQDSIYNNQIILGDRTVPNTWVRGIVVASNNLTVPSYYFNNSVYIRNNGNTSYNSTISGSTHGVQAFYRTYNSTVYLKNNIFYNTATNTGTAMVAAIYTNSTTNWNSDYNLCYTADTSKLNYLGASPAAYNLQAWRSTALSDTNSLSGIVPLTSASDLHINAADANAWNVFGRGMAIANITTDIDSNLRSTTIGMPVCIGFDELSAQPSAAPSDMVMTPATPVSGTPTIFTSAGRKIAEITWTGATVPATLSAKYYPGLQAPGATSATNINSYFDVTATPDSGSSYTIKMYYTTAEINGINETLLKGIKKHAANNYTEISNAGTNAFDANGKFITSNTLADFSIFSMTANTTPLAITLKDISATNVNKSNRINWSTATEAASDVFEMERSADGKTFNRIDIIPAKGTPSSYVYWDNAALAGKNYYRIKVSKQDGSTVYSSIVSATMATTKSFELIAYPNPAHGHITIHINGTIHANSNLIITDMTGKIFKAVTISANECTLNLQSLPAGNYIVRYSDQITSESLQFSLQ
jgi:hypothetical protein